FPPPGAAVGGSPQGGVDREVQDAGISRIDGHRADITARPARDVKPEARVVVAHRDLRDGAREESGPGRATVGAAEERAGLGVDHAWVDRVEEKELDGTAQIEVAPAPSGVGRDVVAGPFGVDGSGTPA